MCYDCLDANALSASIEPLKGGLIFMKNNRTSLFIDARSTVWCKQGAGAAA